MGETTRAWSALAATILVPVGCLLAPDAGDDGGSSGEVSGTESSSTTGVGPSGSGQTTAGSETTDSTSGTTTETTTGASTGTTDETGDTDGTDTTGDTVGDVLPDGCYEEGSHPYSGTLCGPPGSECQVLIDETASAAFTFTNGAPSITYDANCEPQILYSVAVGGFNGHFLQRDGEDDWDDEVTPFALANGGVVYDALAEIWQVVTSDGAFGVSYWTRDAQEGWTDQGALTGQYTGFGKAVAGDGAGGLHVAVTVQGGGLDYAAYDGTWSYTNLSDDGIRPSLGLGVDGVPHITWYEAQNSEWRLFHATPSSIPAIASDYGSNSLASFDHAVTVLPDGPQGDPRIMTAVDLGAGLRELALFNLQGTTWSGDSFVSEVEGETCSTDPIGEFDTCDFDFIRYRPLEIVSSGSDEIRMFYVEEHRQGTFRADCFMLMGVLMCSWVPQMDDSEYTLRVAWPEADGIESAPVVSGDLLRSAEAVVDDLGRVHLAAYSVDGEDDIVVRYLLLSE